MHPQVSVILPFRDAAATLDDALDSIAAQTLPGFECLLIDNGSVDSSAARAGTFAARDARFRVLRCDGSFVDALNAGLAAAGAPFIARMDADDIAHPARLERQLQGLLADPTLSVISCLVRCFPHAELRTGMRRYEAWLNALRTPEAIRDALFVESPIAHPSALIARAALDQVGCYRDTGGPEDYDLWLRLLLNGHRAAKVPEVLLLWRDSPGRLSRSDPRYDRRRFFSTKLEHFAGAVAPGSRVQICGAGPTGKGWAGALIERGYDVDCFIDVAPQRWSRTLYGRPIHSPKGAVSRTNGFALIAAGAPGARERIAAWLHRNGLRPWTDYLAVA